MNNAAVRALVDSCCSRSIIARDVVRLCKLDNVNAGIMLMSGDSVECTQACTVSVSVRGATITLSCLIVDKLPECELIMGVDGIRKLGGVWIKENGDVVFGVEQRLRRGIYATLVLYRVMSWRMVPR